METFEHVKLRLAQRANHFCSAAKPRACYPFTGLISCGACGKHFRRKIANAGSKYAKPAWICPTFNRYGKEACSAQQIPEYILLTRTSEVLGGENWDRDVLLEEIAEIQVPGHERLIYVFHDGHTQEVNWQNPSRRESWTEEMKQKAREDAKKAAKRRNKDDGTH